MIIGLSGYARAGKSTVADMLGPTYNQVSFAEPMRKILMVLDPRVDMDSSENRLTVDEVVSFHGWTKAKSLYPEVRRLLQVLGTQVGREMLGEDFWVNIAMRGHRPGDSVVFTDVRFPNEAQAIVDIGGEVWRINRPGIVAYNAHASETSLDNWKFHRIIENDGTLEELKEKVNE